MGDVQPLDGLLELVAGRLLRFAHGRRRRAGSRLALGVLVARTARSVAVGGLLAKTSVVPLGINDRKPRT